MSKEVKQNGGMWIEPVEFIDKNTQRWMIEGKVYIRGRIGAGHDWSEWIKLPYKDKLCGT